MKVVHQLPAALVSMLADGSWEHPGEEALSELVPFIREPLEFRTAATLNSTREDFLMKRDEYENELFHEYRGSIAKPRGLPWRDIESSFLVAVNRYPGDEVAIGLDYRTSVTDPRVIASEWIDGIGGRCFWREVSPTFTEFVRQLYAKR
ncbi:MAG: hypothetical protein AAF357_00170 [Verrucomicrobiota bacterium]